jgi:hypothetical protein
MEQIAIELDVAGIVLLSKAVLLLAPGKVSPGPPLKTVCDPG